MEYKKADSEYIKRLLEKTNEIDGYEITNKLILTFDKPSNSKGYRFSNTIFSGGLEISRNIQYQINYIEFTECQFLDNINLNHLRINEILFNRNKIHNKLNIEVCRINKFKIYSLKKVKSDSKSEIELINNTVEFDLDINKANLTKLYSKNTSYLKYIGITSSEVKECIIKNSKEINEFVITSCPIRNFQVENNKINIFNLQNDHRKVYNIESIKFELNTINKLHYKGNYIAYDNFHNFLIIKNTIERGYIMFFNPLNKGIDYKEKLIFTFTYNNIKELFDINIHMDIKNLSVNVNWDSKDRIIFFNDEHYIKNLFISGYNNGYVEIKNVQNTKTEFIDFIGSNNYFILSNINYFDPKTYSRNNQKSLKLKNSDLKNTKIKNANLSDYILIFEESQVDNISFSNVQLFDQYKIQYNNIQSQLSQLKINSLLYEMAKQFKSAMINHNDKVNELYFKSLEYYHYRRLIKYKNIFERINLYIAEKTNNYGQNWWKPALQLIAFNIIFSLLLSIYLNNLICYFILWYTKMYSINEF